MGDNLVPRRRNLRPRKPWNAEVIEAPPPRHLRRSRAKLNTSDFLVFDNEEDADFDERALHYEEDIVESSSTLDNNRGSRRSRTSRGNRSNQSQRIPRRTRIVSSQRGSKPSISADSPSRSNRRELRSRRARRSLVEEEDSDEDAEVVDDIIADIDEDEDDGEIEDLEEEDEDGYDSDGEIISSRRSKKRSTSRNNSRKPQKLLPEDVFNRELQPNQPEADPEDIHYSPSVAYLAIFVATFIELFPDLSTLPAPQDIEDGLVSEQPSELVEFLFRRLLGLVLNRKKEIEAGRYSSALSELHSQRIALGMGDYFPPLNWKSRNNAFAELNWVDRAEMLHVLVHWSLASSEKVRQLLKNLNEDSTTPWMGADDAGNRYYIVGFDPIVEGSQEYTRFRVYKETNRLLATVKWEPVASNYNEVVQFLKNHEIKLQKEEIKTKENETEEHHEIESKQVEEKKDEIIADEVPRDTEKASVETEAEPVKYDLPQTVVEILQNFLPSMQLSEQIASDRIEREAKRARRKRDLQYHTEAIARGEGRYAGRFRRRRTNYSEFLRQAYDGGSTNDDDSDEMGSRSRRRLRHRGDDYAWREPEPETREQRHARLLAERAERESQSRDVSEVPRDDAMDVDEDNEQTHTFEPSTVSPTVDVSTDTGGVVYSSRDASASGLNEEENNKDSVAMETTSVNEGTTEPSSTGFNTISSIQQDSRTTDPNLVGTSIAEPNTLGTYSATNKSTLKNGTIETSTPEQNIPVSDTIKSAGHTAFTPLYTHKSSSTEPMDQGYQQKPQPYLISQPSTNQQIDQYADTQSSTNQDYNVTDSGKSQ